MYVSDTGLEHCITITAAMKHELFKNKTYKKLKNLFTYLPYFVWTFTENKRFFGP